jgi:single-strand DNA-binding protein
MLSLYFLTNKNLVMEITARLTGDATVSNLKNEKQVVNFNVAINDSYRQKGSTEITKRVTYVQCSYWVNSTIAKYLTKGTLVELQGRIGVNGYIAKDGTAKGSLTFHVNTIKLHGKSNSNNQAPVVPFTSPTMEPAEDLPF